jgi:chemotaxis protein CheZ
MPAMEFASRYRGKLAQLNHAYATGDAAAFETALEDLCSGRQTSVLADVMRLSDTLHSALSRFRADSRIAALANKDIPDARLRLDHVLAMTEEAANKTMDLIERSVPLANATVRNANELMASLDDRSHNDVRRFLDETRGNFEAVRANLSEVMLTQSFQDLTGQILRGVQRLIGEVEKALGELTRITGVPYGAAVTVLPGHGAAGLEGPAVPGVTQNALTAQADVDDLIAGLGI